MNLSRPLGYCWVLLCLVCAAWVLSGCNLFGFASEESDNPVASAQQFLNDDKPQDALDVIEASAGYRNRTDADLLYLHAKATLIANNISIGGLVSGITNFDPGNPPALLAIPPRGTPAAKVRTDFEEKNKLYQANRIIVRDLEPIVTGRVGNGALVTDSSDVELDYAVSTTINSVLTLRDLNNDNQITYDGDNFALDIFNVLPSQSAVQPPPGTKFSLNGAISVDPVTGEQTLLPGLSSFLPESIRNALSIGIHLPGSKPARSASELSPEYINPLIGKALGLIEDGGPPLQRVIARFASEKGLDPSEVERFVDDAKHIIGMYWYDDGVDNDGDGRTDEEYLNGQDDDRDGRIDEDTQPRAGAAASLALAPGRNTIPERFSDPAKRRRS